MKSIGLLFTLVLVLALCGGCVMRPHTHDRLLFVVPAELSDGAPAEERLTVLEEWMAGRVGGFTRIDGVQGGWMDPRGEMHRESNVLYLLSLPHGVDLDSVRSEIEAKILYDFEQQEAWIQNW